MDQLNVVESSKIGKTVAMNESNFANELIYETNNGTVQHGYNNRLRILYRNIVLDQTYHEFQYLKGIITDLYKYIAEVRHLYYRRFLVRVAEYSLSFALNSKEIEELHELLRGANNMMEVDNLISKALSSK